MKTCRRNQPRVSGHLWIGLRLGLLFFAQAVQHLPCPTISTCRAYLISSGTLAFRCSYVCSLDADGFTHFNLFAMRHTWVSTGNSGRFKQNMSTQAAVFGPTPLNRHSADFTSESRSRCKYSMLSSPRSTRRVPRIFLMTFARFSASPQHLISFSICPNRACSMASYVGNRFFSCANARADVISVVFWDRIVRTRLSSTGTLRDVFFGTSISPWTETSSACARKASARDGLGQPGKGPRVVSPSTVFTYGFGNGNPTRPTSTFTFTTDAAHASPSRFTFFRESTVARPTPPRRAELADRCFLFVIGSGGGKGGTLSYSVVNTLTGYVSQQHLIAVLEPFS